MTTNGLFEAGRQGAGISESIRWGAKHELRRRWKLQRNPAQPGANRLARAIAFQLDIVNRQQGTWFANHLSCQRARIGSSPLFVVVGNLDYCTWDGRALFASSPLPRFRSAVRWRACTPPSALQVLRHKEIWRAADSSYLAVGEVTFVSHDRRPRHPDPSKRFSLSLTTIN
jgi:hypothetical protein